MPRQRAIHGERNRESALGSYIFRLDARDGNCGSAATLHLAVLCSGYFVGGHIYGRVTDRRMRLWRNSLRMFGGTCLQGKLLLPRLPAFERHGDGLDSGNAEGE